MATRGSLPSTALAALIAGALSIAFAPILARIAMDAHGVGSTASAFWRVSLALPVLGLARLVVRRTGGSTPPNNAPTTLDRRWLLLPGLLFGFDLATWHLSFLYTTAANATLFANVSVVLVGLAGWLWLGERVDRRFWLGTCLALAGVGGMVLDGARLEQGWGGRPLGDLLALATAGWYACYLLSVKKIRTSFDAITTLLGVSLGSSLVLGALMLAQDAPMFPSTGAGWWPLMGLALLPHCLGQGLIAHSLAALPASFSAVTLLLQPVAAALWAWLFLDEALSNAQWLAGALVLLGIGYAHAGSRLDGRAEATASLASQARIDAH